MTDKELLFRLGELYGWEVEEFEMLHKDDEIFFAGQEWFKFKLGDGFWFTQGFHQEDGRAFAAEVMLRGAINTLVMRGNEHSQQKGKNPDFVEKAAETPKVKPPGGEGE